MNDLIEAIQKSSETASSMRIVEETTSSEQNSVQEIVSKVITIGEFSSVGQLIVLLKKFNGWYMPDPDGALYRDVLSDDYGILDKQIDTVFEFKLAIYDEWDSSPTAEDYLAHGVNYSTFGGTELTELGKTVIRIFG